MDIKIIQEAGLTEGEAKVYLALLKLGTSTSGPIVEKSSVANSIIYRILNSLIDKGLVSYVTKEKTKYFTAATPSKILDYIEENKEKLDSSKKAIENQIPSLLSIINNTSEMDVQIYEGFKGFITAWEICYTKLGNKDDEMHSWGVYPMQEERFHTYWERDHKRREKEGFKIKILFNQGTDAEILKNRNGFKGCDARYMPTDIKTPAWFVTYKDITIIAIQTRKFENNSQIDKPVAIVITSQEIADTFEAYFQDLWKRSKTLK
jgi:sugar-specific transcriptional regulator TrmB